MDEKRVRISDIADELGLSTATVSNVLHGKTAKVSERTVQKVQALLEERQYVPSMAGILLAQNSSRIIGVVINDHRKYEGRVLEDTFISSSLNCLSAEIERNGRFMMVKTATDPADIIRFASMWNLDGLVLIGFCDQDYMHLRSHMRIPFVVYDGYLTKAERIYNITIDNYDGGLQVGQLFRRLGHSRALCIADNDIFIDHERCEGFRAGFGGGDFLCIPMQREARHRFYTERLSLLGSYTAIFAVSDYYAFELIHFLTANGFRVPQDISVAGFDDTPMCILFSPALTSVRQDSAQRARIAMEKLEQLRTGKISEHTIMLPVQLMERASTCAME